MNFTYGRQEIQIVYSDCNITRFITPTRPPGHRRAIRPHEFPLDDVRIFCHIVLCWFGRSRRTKTLRKKFNDNFCIAKTAIF